MTGCSICSKDKFYYTCVIIFATVCAMLYAQATSIFTPNTYSFDAAIFMHIGRAIKDGYVSYRDIYDIKGPMLWLIEYIGQLIHDGRAGIFLLEIINLNAIAVMTYKAARYYLNQLQSVFCVMISIAFLIGTCRLSSTVEEFTHLYSISAVCITLKNLKAEKGFLKKLDFFICGAAAMCAVLMRVTDCIIVGACIIYAGAVTLKSYGIKKLVINYASALVGAVLVLIPFVAYFAANDAIYDWLDATLYFSFRYSDFNKGPIRIEYISMLLVPIVLSVYSLLKGNKGLPMLSLVTSLMCLVLYIVIGTTFAHYMTMAVPCVFICAVQFLSERRRNRTAVNVIVCILFLLSNVMWIYNFMSATKNMAENMIFADMQSPAIAFANDIKEIIGDEDNDSVYTYHTESSISFVTEYYSNSRYFTGQMRWMNDEKKKDEIYEDFVRGNDTWVIIDTDGFTYGDERILEVINSDYEQVYQYSGFCLYKRVGV